jgi:hypothetical protein
MNKDKLIKQERQQRLKHYLMYVCRSLSIMSFVNIFMRVFGWCTKVTTIPPHFLAKICMSTQSESGHTKWNFTRHFLSQVACVASQTILNCGMQWVSILTKEACLGTLLSKFWSLIQNKLMFWRCNVFWTMMVFLGSSTMSGLRQAVTSYAFEHVESLVRIPLLVKKTKW